MITNDAIVYVTNAAAMMRGLAREAHDHDDHLRAELPGRTRILLRRPPPSRSSGPGVWAGPS